MVGTSRRLTRHEEQVLAVLTADLWQTPREIGKLVDRQPGAVGTSLRGLLLRHLVEQRRATVPTDTCWYEYRRRPEGSEPMARTPATAADVARAQVEMLQALTGLLHTLRDVALDVRDLVHAEADKLPKVPR